MRDLRIDIDAWSKQQSDLPAEQRSPPPGVLLSTVHKVKGAQWPTTFVQMPKGKFPMERPVRPGEPPEINPDALEDERQLAYVAMTRAAKNLRIVCPLVVGGKKAGTSMFVIESNLSHGENVKGRADEDPTKTASLPVDDVAWDDMAGWDELPPEMEDDDLMTPWNPDEV